MSFLAFADASNSCSLSAFASSNFFACNSVTSFVVTKPCDATRFGYFLP